MDTKEVNLKPAVSLEDDSRFYLPGLNLPVDFEPTSSPKKKTDFSNTEITKYIVPPPESGRDLLQTALSDTQIRNGFSATPLLTLRELHMVRVMNDITDKPNWDTKVFKEEIVAKWKGELLSNTETTFTKSMVDWIIAELQYKAKTFQETGLFTVYNGDVVKSDRAIPEPLRESLMNAVTKLEGETPKDWHPGSDEKVLDLVHPSLFPLVYGKSRVVRDKAISLDESISTSGQGEVIPVPELPPSNYSWNQGASNRFSTKFQWLPCDVEVAPDSRCKITSYINNLHPEKFRELYGIIEEVIARAIPQWNLTICPLSNRWMCMYGRQERIPYECVNYVEVPEDEQPQKGEVEDEDTYWDRRWDWETSQTVIQPEPGEFTPPEIPKHRPNKPHADLRRDYEKEGLQVIVKLANIHLSPDKPKYEGGTWHVEGQMNEHIVATALYYFDSENITESRLAFRQGGEVDMVDVSYEQNHSDWVRQIYGCDPDGPVIQEVGSILCKQGRLVTFPNILQHQVQPFELADPAKPGHRKILALFLVDPNIRVISTVNVPPQRHDWFRDEMLRVNALPKLSTELQLNVTEMLDCPIGMDEAKKLREELMEERKALVTGQDEAFSSTRFSLCEH